MLDLLNLAIHDNCWNTIIINSYEVCNVSVILTSIAKFHTYKTKKQKITILFYTPLFYYVRDIQNNL